MTKNLVKEDALRQIENPQIPNRQGFDSYNFEEVMNQLRVPGLSFAIIKDFKIYCAKSYGLADITNEKKTTNETLFQAASISKAVTSMAVLKAAQDGVFSLDEDVNNILKKWQLPKSTHIESVPVTPRALASHTSGLGDGFGFPGYLPGEPLPSVVQILNGDKISNVGKPEFDRAPFSSFKYSGAGSIILQQLLVDSFNKEFPEIIKELVFEPLGMTKSNFEQPLLGDANNIAARAHNYQGKELDFKWRVHPELSAAGLWTTPIDLAKFAIEVQSSVLGKSNKVLSQENVRQMVNPVGVGDYGVGFKVLKEGEGWYFEHGGANFGFQSLLCAHKLKGYGFTAMTNSNSGAQAISELKERIERAFGWDSLYKPIPRI